MVNKGPTKKEQVEAIKKSAILFVEWDGKRIPAVIGHTGVETKHVSPCSTSARIIAVGPNRVAVADYVRTLGYDCVKESES